MKIKHLFGLAVIAAMTASCSSNNDLVNGGNGSSKNETGTAYASFKINLPTTSGTRADVDPDGTPDFNEGTAAEYEVKNGTILIFDKDGKFVESAPLGTMNPWTDVKSDGVTTAAIATVKLEHVSVSGKYKALVLLNNDVDATTTTTKKVKVTLPTDSTDTYANWSKDVSMVHVDDYAKTDGIFMANAPMYSTTEEPTTLVDINGVYASPEEAQAKPATTIYVERGLAKVTMKDFKTGGYTIGGGTYDGATVKIEKWQLDVTNKSTFPVHQTGTLKDSWAAIWNTPRFYDQTSTAFKRVYWGIDPNYSDNKYYNGDATTSPKKTALDCCKDAFNMITNNQVAGAAGDANPQYCLENTFDLNNMKQGQTTRVVFKAVFTPKGFTSAYKTFYKIGNNTTIWSQENLEKQIKAKAQEVLRETDADKVTLKLDATENDIAGTAGTKILKEENVLHDGVKVSPTEINAINEKLGLKAATETAPIVGIATYKDGESYYIARIKHFNEMTPWTPGTAYGSENEKFLGRYGVLRNNWYELSVNKVSGLGYPDVPEVKPTLPDDENDQYISVSVKILDWAKRSQKVDL